MKVITSGNDVRQRVHGTCARCGAVVEIDRGDVHTRDILPFPAWFVWFCPECANGNNLEIPEVWK